MQKRAGKAVWEAAWGDTLRRIDGFNAETQIAVADVEYLKLYFRMGAYVSANPSALTHKLSIAVKLSVGGVEWHLKALVKSRKIHYALDVRYPHLI